MMRATQEADQEALTRAVLDRIDDAVLVLDDDGRVLDANAAALRLLPCDSRRVRGAILLDLIEENVRPPLERLWHEGIAEGAARGALALRSASGSGRELATSIQRDVVPGRHLLVLRDVTDAQERQRELEAARRQLAQTEKLSALGTLTSGVAHEVRTPLTFIASNLYLLRTRLERAVAGGKVERPLLEALDPLVVEALDGVDRINQLVLELRRFSRLKPGNQNLSRLADVVRDAVRLFEVTSRGRHELVLEVEDIPSMLLDSLHVQQVVLNLLENAADATPPGGRIRLDLHATAEGAQLCVEDEGTGIAEDVRARMFEAFYTTKPHGTGLGLSIVRRVVDEHGGEITCSTRPSAGTRFCITLPRRGSAPAE